MRALFLTLTLAIAACTPPIAPNVQSALMGTRWTSANAGPGATTIQFESERASGDAGCNTWFAQMIDNGDSLSFGNVSTTRRMCDPARMEIEHDFIAVLGQTKEARVEDGQLVLRDTTGAELARFDRVASGVR